MLYFQSYPHRLNPTFMGCFFIGFGKIKGRFFLLPPVKPEFPFRKKLDFVYHPSCLVELTGMDENISLVNNRTSAHGVSRED